MRQLITKTLFNQGTAVKRIAFLIMLFHCIDNVRVNDFWYASLLAFYLFPLNFDIQILLYQNLIIIECASYSTIL